MEKRRSKAANTNALDFGSPAFVARFATTAGAFTVKATSSRSKAIETLQKEGILTAKGKLTKRYASK